MTCELPICFARRAMYRAKAAVDAGDLVAAGREFQDCMRQFMHTLCELYPVQPHDGTLPGMLQTLVDCPYCCTTAAHHMRAAITWAARAIAEEPVDVDDALRCMFLVNDMLVGSEHDGEMILPEDGKPADWKWDAYQKGAWS